MPKIKVLPEFDSKPDRSRNFALWDQAVRKTPNAVAYLDTGEEGEENIPKILAGDKISRPFVSYDTPGGSTRRCRARPHYGRGAGELLHQAYLAVYIAAESLLNDKPMPHGWVKVPHVTVDKTNIAAYQKAWEKPETGLRAFYIRRSRRPSITCRRRCRTRICSRIRQNNDDASAGVGELSRCGLPPVLSDGRRR